MKYKDFDLKHAFNTVRKRRETARPNIHFWDSLINYEKTIRGKNSVQILYKNIEGCVVKVPDLYETDYKSLYETEVEKQITTFEALKKDPNFRNRSQKQFNQDTLTWE